MDPRIAAVFDLLRDAQGRRPVFVWVAWSDGSLELHTLPGSPVLTPPVSTGQTGSVAADTPSDIEAALLRVIDRAEKPLKGRAVAARAGLAYNSHLRQVLAGLRRRERIVLAPGGGYWPAGRPVPPGHDPADRDD
jgi:hypothetical protein